MDYIEREAAYNAIVRNYTVDDQLSDLDKIPDADVVAVRHGRWVNRWICSNMTGYEYACLCSECNKSTYRISTLEPMPLYCPNCGALMDKDGDADV